MLQFPSDAPGSDACNRSGAPLLAICPNKHRRLIPFRLLKTGPEDRTPLYGRPFKCKACGSAEVTLFAIESQAEIDEVRRSLPRSADPAKLAGTTHPRRDPDADLP